MVPSKFMDIDEKWWGRAILLTGGRSTWQGCLLLAILGSKKGRPSFGPSAIVTPDEVIRSAYTNREGKTVDARNICTLSAYRSFLYQIAARLQLSDADTTDLFNKARAYISTDFTKGGTDLSGKYAAMKAGRI
jgi:hypothetical protein